MQKVGFFFLESSVNSAKSPSSELIVTKNGFVQVPVIQNEGEVRRGGSASETGNNFVPNPGAQKSFPGRTSGSSFDAKSAANFSVTTAELLKMNETQFGELKLGKIDAELLRQVPAKAFAGMIVEQVEDLTPAMIALLDEDQVAALKPNIFQKFREEHVAAFNPKSLIKLPTANLAALKPEALATMTFEQASNIPKTAWKVLDLQQVQMIGKRAKGGHQHSARIFLIHSPELLNSEAKAGLIVEGDSSEEIRKDEEGSQKKGFASFLKIILLDPLTQLLNKARKHFAFSFLF